MGTCNLWDRVDALYSQKAPFSLKSLRKESNLRILLLKPYLFRRMDLYEAGALGVKLVKAERSSLHTCVMPCIFKVQTLFSSPGLLHLLPERIWGFPKIRDTFLGVPIIRTIVF